MTEAKFIYEAESSHKFSGGSFRITDRYIDWEGTPQNIVEVTLFSGKTVYPLIWSSTKVANVIADNYDFAEMFPDSFKRVKLDEVGYGSYILANYYPMKVEGVNPAHDPIIELTLRYTDSETGESKTMNRTYNVNAWVYKI